MVVERGGRDGGRNGAFDFGEEGRLLFDAIGRGGLFDDAFGLFLLDGLLAFRLDLFTLGAFWALLFNGRVVRLGSVFRLGRVVLFRRVEGFGGFVLLARLFGRFAFLRVAFRRLAVFGLALRPFLGSALGRLGSVVFGDEVFDVFFVVVRQRRLAVTWDGEGIDFALVDFGDEACVILRLRGGFDATLLDGVDRLFVGDVEGSDFMIAPVGGARGFTF